MANLVRNLLLAAEKGEWPLPNPEAWLRGAATFVNAVLVIALARVLAGLVVMMLWGQSSSQVGTTAMITQDSAGRGSAITQPANFSTISAWHLFGQMETPTMIHAPPPPVPVAPLNLRLVGVFFVERGGEKALALIAEGKGVERGYRVGESLPGGARLEQIQRDSVVVSRSGRQEILNLPRLDEARKMTASDGMSPAMPDEPAMPPPPPSPAEPEMPSEPTGFHQPQSIDATAVAARLRGVANQPRALEDIAFASPYVQKGQFLGFRLRPGRDRPLFRQLGFNSGDVLTEVNGNRLDSPLQGLAALRDLPHAEQITVRVLRDGAEIPLAFSLGRSAVE